MCKNNERVYVSVYMCMSVGLSVHGYVFVHLDVVLCLCMCMCWGGTEIGLCCVCTYVLCCIYV